MEQERLVGRGVDRLDLIRANAEACAAISSGDRARLIAHQVAVERQPLDLRERAQHAALHQPAHHRGAGADRAGELGHRGRPAERRQVVDHRAPLRASGRPLRAADRGLPPGSSTAAR